MEIGSAALLASETASPRRGNELDVGGRRSGFGKGAFSQTGQVGLEEQRT